MHNEYGLTWLDSVDVEAMSPTQVSRWTMYARYGFMKLRIKEAVWRFESVYASIYDTRRHLAGEGVTGDITSSSPLWALGAKVSRGKYEGGRERFALDVPAVTSDGWIGWRGLLRWREGFVCELLVCEACTGTGVLRRLLLGLETGLLGCWRSPLPQQQSQQHGIQQ